MIFDNEAEISLLANHTGESSEVIKRHTGGDAGTRPLRLETFLGYRVWRLGFSIVRTLAATYAADRQLSHSEWKVLSILADSDGLTGSEITARSTLDKFAVSKTIKRLRARNLLAVGERYDRRAIKLGLTERGWALYTPIAEYAREQQETLFGALTDAERQQLFQLLDKLDAASQANR